MKCATCGKYMPDNPFEDDESELSEFVNDNELKPAKAWCSQKCADEDEDIG